MDNNQDGEKIMTNDDYRNLTREFFNNGSNTGKKLDEQLDIETEDMPRQGSGATNNLTLKDWKTGQSIPVAVAVEDGMVVVNLGSNTTLHLGYIDVIDLSEVLKSASEDIRNYENETKAF